MQASSPVRGRFDDEHLHATLVDEPAADCAEAGAIYLWVTPQALLREAALEASELQEVC